MSFVSCVFHSLFFSFTADTNLLLRKVNRKSEIRVRIYFVSCISLKIDTASKSLKNQFYIFRMQFLRIYQLFHDFYMHLPPTLPSFYHPDNIWLSTQFAKILIFLVFGSCFLPSNSLVSIIFINTFAMKNLTPTLLFPKGKIPNFTFEQKGRCTKKSIEVGEPFWHFVTYFFERWGFVALLANSDVRSGINVGKQLFQETYL